MMNYQFTLKFLEMVRNVLFFKKKYLLLIYIYISIIKYRSKRNLEECYSKDTFS